MGRFAAAFGGLAGWLVAAALASAQPSGDPAEPETDAFADGMKVQLGVHTWVLLPSEYAVSVADQQLRASTGVGVGVTAELLELDGFGGGLSLSFLRRPSDDVFLSDTLLTHLGVQGGPRLLISDRVLVGASALLGLHVLAFRNAEELSLGLGAGAAALVALRVTEVVWLQAQLGALAQPLGGHEATDVTFEPTPLAIIGFGALLPPRP